MAMRSLLLTTEQFLKQVKALVLLIVAVLLFGTISYALVAHMPPAGAFVLTIETLAGGGKSGNGELLNIPGTYQLQIGLHLLGAMIIWFAVWTTFGLAVEGRFGEFFKEVKTLNQIKNLQGHYIVCGAGRVGKHIGSRLRKSGEQVVFIEKDKDAVNRLRSEGYLVIDVGPIDEHVLIDAGIKTAKGIAVSLGDDAKNFMLVLAARELNPDLKIAVRCNDAKLVPKLRKAGADFIILPEALGGIKLADALRGKVDKEHVFTK